MKRTTKKPVVSVSPEAPHTTTVTDCIFTGVHWDAKASEVVREIATALSKNASANEANARAIRDLVAIMLSQNVSIDAMLRVGGKEEKT